MKTTNIIAPVHHRLDPYPIPKEESPMYINEPWLIDSTCLGVINTEENRESDNEDDNIRIYVPIDLNYKAILRRLSAVVAEYGEANEENEWNFSLEVDRLISQIEIYD